MNPHFADESLLVKALHQHTATGFTLLYQTYANTLYSVLARLVKDPVLAQDLLQDTFVRVWLNSHHYDPARGRLFTWLLTLARHTALDALKANQRRLLLTGLALDWLEGEATSVRFEGRVAGSLLMGLAPKYGLIVELIYLQGYTAQEVARQLGLPLGTVKTRLRSALHQLRLIYQQDISHYGCG